MNHSISNLNIENMDVEIHINVQPINIDKEEILNK